MSSCARPTTRATTPGRRPVVTVVTGVTGMTGVTGVTRVTRVMRVTRVTRHHTWTSTRRYTPLHTATHRYTPLHTVTLCYCRHVQALFHAKLTATPAYVGEVTPAVAAPLSAFPLIKRQLQFLCAQPDATQQLKEIGARCLAGGAGLASRLLDELTGVFVRLVGPIPGWWSARGIEGTTEQAARHGATHGHMLRHAAICRCMLFIQIDAATCGLMSLHAVLLHMLLHATPCGSTPLTTAQAADTEGADPLQPVTTRYNPLQAADTEVDDSRLDDDVRLRRYTEMWCRFVLILEPPPEEGANAPPQAGRGWADGGAIRAVDVVRWRALPPSPPPNPPASCSLSEPAPQPSC